MKFSLLLLLLLIIAALLPLLVTNKETVKVRYAVQFTLDNELSSVWSAGDHLIDGVGKEPIGTVETVLVTPALSENANGIFPLPDKSRVLLTVVCDGARAGNALSVGGITLLTGKRLSLHGKGVAYGVCLWAEEVTE